MKELKFGTAGIPFSTPGKQTTEEGIAEVKNLGLSSMELEFVRQVYVTEEKAPLIRSIAEKEKVLLTSHGSYFINLNAADKAKLNASIERIKKACWITHLCGGYSVCFHAAYYMKQSSSTVYPKIKKNVKSIVKDMQNKGVRLWIRPETTGKPTQFGDINELIKLSSEVEQVLPVVDFSHLHARSNGKYNSVEETREVLSAMEKGLGREALDNMHIHLSGIDYGEKGEKKHLILKESDLKYKEILQAWKEFKLKGTVVCESPNLEKDALLLQKTFNGL